ncbi:hypothetical protein [Kingella oralis]|nr:hypothetical protein [Kingella oralis]
MVAGLVSAWFWMVGNELPSLRVGKPCAGLIRMGNASLPFQAAYLA